MQGIDRLMQEDVEYSATARAREVLLPIVEQIDPALVPEYFWRIVAMRPSVGNPHYVNDLSSSWLALLLAWYDRDVAAAMFEPVRAWLEHIRRQGAGRRGPRSRFRAWSMFDPRAAVARLEKVPVDPKLDIRVDDARQRVAGLLGLPHEARWHYVWDNYSDTAAILHRDLY